MCGTLTFEEQVEGLEPQWGMRSHTSRGKKNHKRAKHHKIEVEKSQE